MTVDFKDIRLKTFKEGEAKKPEAPKADVPKANAPKPAQ